MYEWLTKREPEKINLLIMTHLTCAKTYHNSLRALLPSAFTGLLTHSISQYCTGTGSMTRMVRRSNVTSNIEKLPVRLPWWPGSLVSMLTSPTRRSLSPRIGKPIHKKPAGRSVWLYTLKQWAITVRRKKKPAIQNQRYSVTILVVKCSSDIQHCGNP